MLAALLPFSIPPYDYFEVNLQGWTVHVERSIRSERPRLWDAAKNELTCQLMRIERIVPDGPLGQLKKVPLWIHLKNPINQGAAFHPSEAWLVEHQQDPQMAKGIEFGNAENLVSWSYVQPWMAMHELAHAYHNLYMEGSFDNAAVKAAFDNAVASHKYDNILWADGHMGKSYGLTNPMEYFAETSEAYLGQNDGYPFIRAELKTFDPMGYELMRKTWGEPARKVPAG